MNDRGTVGRKSLDCSECAKNGGNNVNIGMGVFGSIYWMVDH